MMMYFQKRIHCLFVLIVIQCSLIGNVEVKTVFSNYDKKCSETPLKKFPLKHVQIACKLSIGMYRMIDWLRHSQVSNICWQMWWKRLEPFSFTAYSFQAGIVGQAETIALIWTFFQHIKKFNIYVQSTNKKH